MIVWWSQGAESFSGIQNAGWSFIVWRKNIHVKMTEENWSVSRNIFLESIMHETESDRKNLCIYYRYLTHEELHPFTYFQRTLTL